MYVIAVQLDIVWHDKTANHDRVRRMLAGAHVPPGTLLVLPEMFATGFSMDVAHVADDPRRETEQFLHALAREYDACVIGGLVTRSEDGRGRNEALIAFPDATSQRYRKIQPFTPGGESDHYAAGGEIVLFDWQGFRIAPFICYDLRFPELYRIAMLRGAQTLVTIASWPVAREEHWVALLRARAIENQCYVVGVNRAGRDPNFTYPGRSHLLGPKGGTIADAGTKEGIIAADLSLDGLLEYRRELPFIVDTRGEFLPQDQR